MLRCVKCGNIAFPALKHLHGLGVNLCFACTQKHLRKFRPQQVIKGSEIAGLKMKGKR